MSRLHTVVSLASLGTNFWNRFLIASSYCYCFLREKIPFLPRIPISVRLDVYGIARTVSFASISDHWAMKDVFVDGEYGVDLGFEPTTIVDLGANVGMSALFFASRYPRAQIYAFEPHPETYKKLLENVSGVPSIHAYNWAVSDVRGKRVMYGSDQSTHSSVVADVGASFEVDSLLPDDLFSFLKIESIDVVKFDIEGAESCLFRGFSGFGKVRVYIGEMHYDLLDLQPADIQTRARGYRHSETFKKQGKKRSVLFLARESLRES